MRFHKRTPVRRRFSIAFTVLLPSLLPGGGASAQENQGEIVLGSYERVFSAGLNEDRVLKVKLPVGYGVGEQRYPVLYLLDAEWEALFNLASGTVDHAAEADITPEMIVVGISNTDRTRDMIPTVVADLPGSGGGREFLEFITQELVPYVDDRYRANSNNILYGGSSAGLFTVFAILERPDVFFAGIAGSPMIGFCKEFIYRTADRLKDREDFEGTFLYMIYGENDYPKSTEYAPEFHNYLKEVGPEGFESELVQVTGEGHVPYMSLYNGLKRVFSRR